MKNGKKILALLLAFIMPVLLAVPAMALDSYELFARWEQDGYPEDVTGVFYNIETKYLAIVLTNNTETRQKELRDSLSDGNTLTFFTGEYSHTQLAECAEAIRQDLAESGIEATVSIGWGANGGYGTDGKDFRVVIKTEAENIVSLTERYAEYSNMAVVEENIAAVPEETTPEQPEKQGLSDWAIIGIAAVAAVAFIILITVIGNKKRAKKGNIQL